MTMRKKTRLTAAQEWLQAEQAKANDRNSMGYHTYARPAVQLPGEGKPTADELVAAMLRDYRFKKVMLANAELVFSGIPPEVKLQLFREAASELLKSYKIKDVKQIYRLLGMSERLRVSNK